MTILQSLAAFHERLQARGDAADLGWAPVRFGYSIQLAPDGRPQAPIPLGDPSAKRRGIEVIAPAPVIRTSGIASNFLWEKPAYALGLVLIEETVDGEKRQRAGQGKRTAQEHQTFRELHLEALAATTDPGLKALARFLDYWSPELFEEFDWPVEALAPDINIAFRFDGDDEFLFGREAARELVDLRAAPKGDEAFCLVSGARAPIARLHPPVKGVYGAQTSGAAIVSFNLDAFESYGRSQGANAPVSDLAAFRYTSALNWLLGRGNTTPRRIVYRLQHSPKQAERTNNLRTADASVVFWAEERGSDREPLAQAAEEILGDALTGELGAELLSDDDVDLDFANDADRALRELARGVPASFEMIAEEIEGLGDVRLCVLGLSPNNARIAPRFWIAGPLRDFARHVVAHRDDLDIDPPAFRRPPGVGRLLRETAIKGEFENVPPRLSGELMRSILTGSAYPRTLVTAVLGRIRADKRVTGARAALLKAVINRDLRLSKAPTNREIPVALDVEASSPAYQLGRLFALVEGVQKAALPGLSATVKDRYFGAACATPARVFPLLMKNSVNHLSLVRKSGRPKLAGWFESEIGKVWAMLSEELPRALRPEDQGRFVAGYYHQRFAKKQDAPAEADTVLQSEPETEEGDSE